MSVLLVVLLALLATAALLAVISPLRRNAAAAPLDPDAAERLHLEAERDALMTQLVGLSDESRRPDLENRAARNLRALDGLPPPPGRGGTWLPAATGVVLALLVVGVGAVTFVPQWQLAALDSGERLAVKDAVSLPGLQAQAQRSGDKADYLAWGDAAFSASVYDQASAAYASTLKLDPRQPKALRRLGIMLLSGQGRAAPKSEQQASQAFLLVRTAAQLAPNDPESQLLLGYALNNFGENKLALAALERYRNLDPTGRDADDLIATLRASSAQTDPASRVYAANCASCHGASGRGGIGPNLHESRLGRAELQSVIQNGKGSMPAFPNIRGAELSALLTRLEEWEK
ncbi:c-type cytochrome [Deinococcus rubellus]|uniref:C-type cytochrome n=1 Tax=Deinococcus rubellus TaxID=1889240 RepID=A0ABY5YK00_9DEIO|nr:c-type cytochrome [Deinococcus rubellus]UWX64088.1 c-type cytochrome [Deinococcus rubellus]